MVEFPPGSGVTPPDVLKSMSGLDFLRGILDGSLPPPPIMITLGYRPSELEVGRVVFTAQLDGRAYNPIGMIHGGRRTALATGEIFDRDGKLCAFASSTCLIFES